MKSYISARNIPGVTFIAVLIALSIVLSACASGPSTNPDGSINVEVTLTDFGIESSLIEFEAGKTYHFTITNEGVIPHEFVIAEPLTEATEHSDMEMMHRGLILAVEESDLSPGTTVTTEVTFPDHVVEDIEFACHTEGHYEAGMHLPITMLR